MSGRPPDYQDWPDFEGDTDAGLGNGRRQRPDATQPGHGGPPPGQPSEWHGPVGPGWPAPGWSDPSDQPDPGWDDPQDEPEWRDAAGATDPRGIPPLPGHWQDPRPRAGEPAPGGEHDSGRVVPGRAQRNSGRITGRLTRRTQRGGRPAPRRDLDGGAQTPPPRPEPPGPAARPAWMREQPGAGPPWSPEGRGQAPPPGQPPAWTGGDRPTPPPPPPFGAPPPPTGAQRPAPPPAWARGEPSDRFAAPPGGPVPLPPAPGSGDGPPLPTPPRGHPRHGAHGRARTRRLPGLPKPSLPSVKRARIPQASLALAGIAIVVAGGLAGLMGAVPKAAAPAAVDAGAPYSARWVCPLLPSSVGTVVADNLGQRAAAMRVGVNALRSQGAAGPGGKPAADLPAGASRTMRAQSGPSGGFVQVEAFGAPIAATSADQPTCVPGPATRWWLPGLVATNQTRVTLVIANPEAGDATVNIFPHVSEGSQHPEALQNVFVKAGTTVRKDLNVPELQGLPFTAEVRASQGRVVVGTRMDTRIGSRKGSLIVPAQQAERPSWLFSGGLAGEARQVELLVTNPNPRALSLVVEGANDQGPFKVPGFDLPVPDGASNEAIVPVQFGKTGAFSLRVRSKDGSRFVAALRFGPGGDPANASSLDLGGSGLDARWMAPVAPASGRVVLANTAATPVTATLSALARSGGGAAAQAGPAGQGSAVTVQPGQVRIAAVPKGARSLLLVADGPGLVAAPVGAGQLVPGSQVGGVPLAGAVTPGPAAAP